MSTPNELTGTIPRSFLGTWRGNSKIVVGIDIGTTHSVVAFAFLLEGIELAVQFVTCWPGQESHNQQSKIPTLVWYDTNKKAVAFGAEAESQGAKNHAEDNGWQLAKHFKLHLHPDDMKAKLDLTLDPLPRDISLYQIYSDFLIYLFKHTRAFFEAHILDGRTVWEAYSPNIEVVITHPNGWGTRERGFLRSVAMEAGLASVSSPHKIQFATEAEAIFHFSAYRTDPGGYLQIGARFALCDVGESTVDTAVYSVVEVSHGLKLGEVRASACIQTGAIFVDAAAENYIRDLLTKAQLPKQDVEDYTIRGVKDFNLALKRSFCDATRDEVIEIAGTRLHIPSIRTIRGRMTIPGAVIKSFFDVCLDEIMASVDQQIRGLAVSFIFLVGEFWESPYLWQKLKARYEPQGCQVILRNEPTSKVFAEGAIIWSIASNASSGEELPVLCRQSQRPQGEYDSLLSQMQPQEEYFKELRLLDATMREKDTKLRELDQAYERLARELAELSQQAECIRSEHISLRSQIRLRETIDLSETVQALKNLNREVEDVGRLISAYLTYTYVQKIFGKDPSNVTVLNAIHMSELEALLGHVDGRSSLIASWDYRVAMPIEAFLDYAIRTLLCKQLCERIFTPFHPAINSSLSDAITAMYHDVQQQETQTVAARWRANYFKAIYKPRTPDAVAYHIGVIAREFVNSSLSPLLTYCFGEKAEVEPENQQLDRITRLFRAAWDWNFVLKGEIVLQGDFHPTYYGPLHRFDPDVMTEFKPNPRKPQPEYILGTLGLGLSSSHAVGGGKRPEETVVYKATVVTKSLY
ncbi:hypothetical protein FRC08_008054 [Ceratobasidium sp. 394]|nr:hypothetical protein FRC08_008054 [Ceratobasidium sp. 394]